jgi:hypothetical protein
VYQCQLDVRTETEERSARRADRAIPVESLGLVYERGSDGARLVARETQARCPTKGSTKGSTKVQLARARVVQRTFTTENVSPRD